MEYKIINKPAFKVIGVSKTFKSEEGFKECPKFWDEHYQNENSKYILGMYGICIDDLNGSFKYMIADNYEDKNFSDKFEVIEIPDNTWAVFQSIGPIPQTLQKLNTDIFTKWLPNNSEYILKEMVVIECYSDTTVYPKGTLDENYYCEIWVPVIHK